MVHASPPYAPLERWGTIKEFFSSRVFSGLAAKYKASRDAKAAIMALREYTDAELADIGLQRSDLAPDAFEEAADSRAKAIVRIYC